MSWLSSHALTLLVCLCHVCRYALPCTDSDSKRVNISCGGLGGQRRSTTLPTCHSIAANAGRLDAPPGTALHVTGKCATPASRKTLSGRLSQSSLQRVLTTLGVKGPGDVHRSAWRLCTVSTGMLCTDAVLDGPGSRPAWTLRRCGRRAGGCWVHLTPSHSLNLKHYSRWLSHAYEFGRRVGGEEGLQFAYKKGVARGDWRSKDLVFLVASDNARRRSA